ncbi:OmpA/MotB family protein [Desulfobulbus alkaliphilus]|uniref:OmpA/MotB family protein n=1 Tax=Desulfobulbus alkaliphilus TaxID=869814 RepID=UPI00196579C3|nr:flagellar motor protein MotB [Desulfobulbus alkaliphilus]MBM9537426.1 flagellar motor protein MotB [Desulfobulbus alkaliphilus]
MAREKQKQCPPGLPIWILTYSDMVTLLLVFFVLLLSMANLDPIKFLQAKTSLRDAFGWRSIQEPVQFSIPIIPSPPRTQFTPIPMETSIQHLRRIKTDLQTVRIDHQVEVLQKDNDSIILRINESVLFDVGSATLKPSSYPILRKVASIVRPLPMSKRIEGHSDNIPMIAGPRTNWDLSVDRAVAVMAFYHRGDLFPQDRMSAAGYGDFRPIAANTTAEGRALNRRVDFILRSDRSIAQEGTPSTPIPF